PKRRLVPQPKPLRKIIHQVRTSCMRPKRSLIYILAVLITLLLFGTVAPATTIDVIVTFDFPGTTVTATLPQKIEDQTDLVGTVMMADGTVRRSEEHTSELQSRFDLVCRLL